MVIKTTLTVAHSANLPINIKTILMEPGKRRLFHNNEVCGWGARIEIGLNLSKSTKVFPKGDGPPFRLPAGHTDGYK